MNGVGFAYSLNSFDFILLQVYFLFVFTSKEVFLIYINFMRILIQVLYLRICYI